MAQRRTSPHTTSGQPLDRPVKMRLDARGRWVAVTPKAETTPTTEAAERPPTPDDPRVSSWRQIPPFGGGT